MTRQTIIKIFLSAVILTSCFPRKKTAKEYFNLGQDYENRGQLKNALKAYERAIKKNHKEPYYYVKKAEMLYLSPFIYNHKKTGPKIESAYNKAMNLQPWYDKASLSRAHYWYWHGNLKLARENADSLIKKHPDNVDGHLLLAKIYFDKKDDVNAEYNLNKVLEKSKNSRDYVLSVADIYQEYKMYQKAISLFRNVLDKSDKVTYERYYSLAVCYYRLNKSDSTCYFYTLRNNKSCFGKECKAIDTLCSVSK